MASTDARPVAWKNAAYRVTFPIFDGDGDLVTGAAGLDSEVSLDGGTFADCTNEATEIATNSGMYYLDLTSDEMNADTVAVLIKTSTVGAKTTPIVLYPEEPSDIRVNVTQIGDSNVTAAAGIPEVKVASIANDAITANAIAAGALTAAKFAAGAFDAVWSVASRLLTAGTNIVLAKGTGVTGFNDLDAPGVRAAVGMASNNLDTQLAAIGTKTTNLPANPAAVSDIPTAVQNADALLDRDMATGTDSGSSSVRTVRQALRFLRNKWTIAGGTLTVYKEDDTTASWASAVTSDGGADPVTGSDPAGP